MKFTSSFIALAALVAVAGCETPQEQVTAPGQALNVVAVSVSTANLRKSIYTVYNLPNARVEAVAQDVILRHLEQFDDDRGAPVTVQVDLTRLHLAGGASALLGSTTSSVGAAIAVTSQSSKAPVVSGLSLFALGEKRLSGLIGVAMVKGQEQEMALVSAGLADKMGKALFGR